MDSASKTLIGVLVDHSHLRGTRFLVAVSLLLVLGRVVLHAARSIPDRENICGVDTANTHSVSELVFALWRELALS